MLKINQKRLLIITFFGGNMLVFHNTAIQVRPCIASRARFALGLKITQPQPNENTNCTFNYWERVIETLSIIHNINQGNQQQALEMFDDLFNN